MLPRQHRLTDGRGFTAATRGRRSGGRGLVVHRARPLELATEAGGDRIEEPVGEPARVGLVVSRAVGNAVVRNRVKRRLRHLLGGRVAALPLDSTFAVRALPAAAAMTSAELAAELDRGLARVCADRAVDAGDRL